MSDASRPANRLARETSPYLLQHAHNPVDWYPWGEEAFAKARAEDKPIFLSVGYATCHWCHVMERESFEDEAVARLLNEGFVPIKVDREELPDVDHVYMSALQAMARHGGWPMNMFLTPDLKPFYGGTYFPPQPRFGMPAFTEVLRAVREAWVGRRAEIERHAQALLDHLRDGRAPPPRTLPDDVHAPAVAQLARRFDGAHGGFGEAPKFPQAPLLQYLLALAAGGDERARAMLTATLAAMAAGGIYDHVGGGFARYSTDARWHVPHFEKMLYDNVQLVRVYVGAYRLTGDARLRFVAEDTLAWLAREMHPRDAPAAFSSAQDADSEGVEGKFYVWRAEEFRAVLGGDADAAARLYGVVPEGNWEHGANVLQRREPEAVRASLGLSADAFDRWERSVRERLYRARARRVPPLTDDKVLADWNGMALRALAEAGRLLGRADLVEAARALARFLLDTMTRDGRLCHAYRAGRLRAESYLADYAQVALGLVELHAASGEPHWLDAARALAERMVERFHTPDEGFYDGASDGLPLRARDPFDGAAPSGSAAACELLLRLSGIYDRSDWADLAERTIERHAGLLAHAEAAPALLHARLLAERGAELALPVEPGAETDLIAAAQAQFAPLVTLAIGAPGAVPVLVGRTPGAAYLCRRGACELPARSSEDLALRFASLWRD
ncbi:MAG: thioredoxin domain-containing protein [Burkholderiaceae bacterium]